METTTSLRMELDNLRRLKEDLDRVRLEKETLTRDCASMKTELESVKAAAAAATLEIEELRLALEKKEAEKRDVASVAEEEKAELEHEVNGLRNEKGILESRLENVEHTLTLVEDERDVAVDKAVHFDALEATLKQSNESLRATVEGLESEFRVFKEEKVLFESKTDAIQGLREKVASLKKELGLVREEKAALFMRNRELENTLKVTDEAAARKISSLESALRRAHEEVEKFSKQLKNQKDKFDSCMEVTETSESQSPAKSDLLERKDDDDEDDDDDDAKKTDKLPLRSLENVFKSTV